MAASEPHQLPGQRSWRLFVSYTGQDLEAHARRVADVARRQQRWIVDDHLDWPVSDRPSVQECVAHVQRCDALMLLVAHRIGWVPTAEEGGTGLHSICEIEWAAATNLPRAAILADPDRPFGVGDGVPSRFRGELAKLAGVGGPSNMFNEDPTSIDSIADRALTDLDRQLTERYETALRSVQKAEAKTATARLAKRIIDGIESERDAPTADLFGFKGLVVKPVGGGAEATIHLGRTLSAKAVLVSPEPTLIKQLTGRGWSQPLRGPVTFGSYVVTPGRSARPKLPVPTPDDSGTHFTHLTYSGHSRLDVAEAVASLFCELLGYEPEAILVG